jgi:hypothetical protein
MNDRKLVQVFEGLCGKGCHDHVYQHIPKNSLFLSCLHFASVLDKENTYSTAEAIDLSSRNQCDVTAVTYCHDNAQARNSYEKKPTHARLQPTHFHSPCHVLTEHGVRSFCTHRLLLCMHAR